MNIEQIELYHIRISLTAPFETSFGVATDRETILVRMTDADGVAGWGEYTGDGPGYSYETVQTGWHIMRDFLIPEAFKSPINAPAECVKRFAPVRGHNMAKAAMEAAIWDLAAQRENLSLRDYIGKVTGRKMKDRVSVGVSIGIQSSPEKLVERVMAFKADGYGRIKMKIKPGRDIGDARAVRKAIPEMMLMVDANSAYSLKDADMLKQMDDLGLIMIEQPLAYDDVYEHHKLQRELKTPICLDESIHAPDHARMALELGACKIINIKQGRVGGVTSAIEIHDICEQAGAPVWCGGMLETGIGRAYNLALAALPNFRLPSDLSASNRYYNPDIIEPVFELNTEDSTLTVPTGKGLGVNVQMDRLTRLTLQHSVFRKGRAWAVNGG